MKKSRHLVFLILMFVLVQCDDDPFHGGGTTPEVTTGVLEIDFTFPYTSLPDKNIHRINLSIARTSDSLNRGLFISSANVSDSRSLYRFVVAPGTYFYKAGITCSCLGDSCLWGGFPGGRYGVRWAIDKAEVKLGEVTRESPSFQ